MKSFSLGKFYLFVSLFLALFLCLSLARGEILANETAIDDDGDGYSEDDGDCNDVNSEINPGAIEVCDGIDNDCNNLIDEYDANVADAILWYIDADDDGYGDDSSSFMACYQPYLSADVGGDCDDNNSSISPAATESCDSIDNDCSGFADDGVSCSVTPEEPTDSSDNSSDQNGTPSGSGSSAVSNSLGACELVQDKSLDNAIFGKAIFVLAMIMFVANRCIRFALYK